MRFRLSNLFFIVFLSFGVAAPSPVWADYKTGLEAYKKKNYTKAIKEWQPLAEKGNAQIQYTIGIIYYRGLGDVPKNFKLAAKWLSKAANEHNHSKAQGALGYMYERGLGVQKDIKKAIQLYRKAAAQGFKAASKALRRLKVDTKPKSASKNGEVKLVYKGITLMAVPPAPGAKFKVNLLTPKEGIAKLRKALDLIYQKSSFSVTAIEKLKRNGNLIIIYNPSLPQTRGGGILAAVFLPEYFRKKSDIGGGKDFVVVVGLNGIKWPTPELGMVVVHELVGHGMQQFNGQMEYIREIDLECTANLYGERFYQDIKINKHQREIIQFRQALENYWCSDFKRYMRKHTPNKIKLWDRLNPDVPGLIKVFNQYARYMRDQGISGKAIQASKKDQREKFAKLARKIETEGTPQDKYLIGTYYRDGIGAKQNRAKAVEWFQKAALLGYHQAQADLALMYMRGLGTAKNLKKAAAWYYKAALQGNAGAQYNLGVLYARGEGVKQQLVRSYAWIKTAINKLEKEHRGKATNLLKKIHKHMTPEKLEQAKQLMKKIAARQKKSS